MAASINRVILVGNLTRDPSSGTRPRACRSARPDRGQRPPQGRDGPVADKPNYFSVTVWGQQGENCAQYLAKGRPVAIDGRLDWREWETQDGAKREAVEIVADSVQFLGGRGDGEGGAQYVPAGAAQAADADFAPSAADDDIPF